MRQECLKKNLGCGNQFKGQKQTEVKIQWQYQVVQINEWINHPHTTPDTSQCSICSLFCIFWKVIVIFFKNEMEICSKNMQKILKIHIFKSFCLF